MNGSEHFVTLTGGLIVPLPVLQALWALEDRGVHLRLDGETIIANRRGLLTDADRAVIRRWRAHVVELLTYASPERAQ